MEAHEAPRVDDGASETSKRSRRSWSRPPDSRSLDMAKGPRAPAKLQRHWAIAAGCYAMAVKLAGPCTRCLGLGWREGYSRTLKRAQPAVENARLSLSGGRSMGGAQAGEALRGSRGVKRSVSRSSAALDGAAFGGAATPAGRHGSGSRMSEESRGNPVLRVATLRRPGSVRAGLWAFSFGSQTMKRGCAWFQTLLTATPAVRRCRQLDAGQPMLLQTSICRWGPALRCFRRPWLTQNRGQRREGKCACESSASVGWENQRLLRRSDEASQILSS